MKVFKCKGCLTYEDAMSKEVDSYAVCNHIPFVKDNNCPCHTCVVKSMCIEPCDIYIEYIEWLIDNYGHMLDENKASLFKRWISDFRQATM